MRVQLLWRMSAHLRVSLSSLLLELASRDARAPVPSRNAGKNGEDRVNAGFEYKRLTFRETVRHAFVHNSGGVVDTSGLALFKFLYHLHSALAFLVQTQILATM